MSAGIVLKGVATPTAPPVGYVRLFVDQATGDFYVQDSAGVVTAVGGIGPTGPAGADAAIYFIIPCSDETTDLTTGAAKVTLRAPFAFTVTEVRASATEAPTGSALQVDINEGGVSILSTVISIDAGAKTSTTSVAPAVISDASIADDAEITVDIDAVGSTTPGKGLKVTLIGYAT